MPFIPYVLHAGSRYDEWVSNSVRSSTRAAASLEDQTQFPKHLTSSQLLKSARPHKVGPINRAIKVQGKKNAKATLGKRIPQASTPRGRASPRPTSSNSPETFSPPGGPRRRLNNKKKTSVDKAVAVYPEDIDSSHSDTRLLIERELDNQEPEVDRLTTTRSYQKISDFNIQIRDKN